MPCPHLFPLLPSPKWAAQADVTPTVWPCFPGKELELRKYSFKGTLSRQHSTFAPERDLIFIALDNNNKKIENKFKSLPLPQRETLFLSSRVVCLTKTLEKIVQEKRVSVPPAQIAETH